MTDSSEVEFLQALADAGFPVSAVSDIRERYAPMPDGLAMFLIDWLPRLRDSRLQETVAWSLLAARKRMLDGRRLAALFDETSNAEMKTALAAVFNQTGPLNSDDWLIAALGRTASVAARNLLASAIAKWLPVEKSVPTLLSIFDQAPLAVVHPLGKVGGEEVREVLRHRLATATGPLRRELRQAIKRIERRLAKSQPACQCDRP